MVKTPIATYEIYRHKIQSGNGRIKGCHLEAHLRLSGLLDRALSKESALVKGWLANPETFPEELRAYRSYLWGSAQRPDPKKIYWAKRHHDVSRVPYLQYSYDTIFKRWSLTCFAGWIDTAQLGHDSPALLEPATLNNLQTDTNPD